LLKQRMMVVVVTTGLLELKSCKAPDKSSPPPNQHPVLFTGRMPRGVDPVAQPTVSKH